MPVPADRSTDVQNKLTSSLVNYTYDSSGEMLTDGTGDTVTYDAEGRIKTAGGATYTYNGLGERVAKVLGATTTEYWDNLVETDSTGNQYMYIFLNGRRLARFDNAHTNITNYYLTDMLGSASVVANDDGTIDSESDFYPFGGEKVISATGTGQHFKFTSKERDTESGLDYFGARYYANSMGRWMSPDWSAKPEAVPYAKLDNPQSLNLYGYVNNNPLLATDPDGHEQLLQKMKNLIEGKGFKTDAELKPPVVTTQGEGASVPAGSTGALPKLPTTQDTTNTQINEATDKFKKCLVTDGGVAAVASVAGDALNHSITKPGETTSLAETVSSVAGGAIDGTKECAQKNALSALSPEGPDEEMVRPGLLNQLLTGPDISFEPNDKPAGGGEPK